MQKGELLNKINDYFANTSKEHLQKVYDELKEFEQYGPDVDEYLNMIKHSSGKEEYDRLNRLNSNGGAAIPMIQLAR